MWCRLPVKATTFLSWSLACSRVLLTIIERQSKLKHLLSLPTNSLGVNLMIKVPYARIPNLVTVRLANVKVSLHKVSWSSKIPQWVAHKSNYHKSTVHTYQVTFGSTKASYWIKKMKMSQLLSVIDKPLKLMKNICHQSSTLLAT